MIQIPLYFPVYNPFFLGFLVLESKLLDLSTVLDTTAGFSTFPQTSNMLLCYNLISILTNIQKQHKIFSIKKTAFNSMIFSKRAICIVLTILLFNASCWSRGVSDYKSKKFNIKVEDAGIADSQSETGILEAGIQQNRQQRSQLESFKQNLNEKKQDSMQKQQQPWIFQLANDQGTEARGKVYRPRILSQEQGQTWQQQKLSLSSSQQSGPQNQQNQKSQQQNILTTKTYAQPQQQWKEQQQQQQQEQQQPKMQTQQQEQQPKQQQSQSQSQTQAQSQGQSYSYSYSQTQTQSQSQQKQQDNEDNNDDRIDTDQQQNPKQEEQQQNQGQDSQQKKKQQQQNFYKQSAKYYKSYFQFLGVPTSDNMQDDDQDDDDDQESSELGFYDFGQFDGNYECKMNLQWKFKSVINKKKTTRRFLLEKNQISHQWYTPQTLPYRIGQFSRNLQQIIEHNQKNQSYKTMYNFDTDLNHQQFFLRKADLVIPDQVKTVEKKTDNQQKYKSLQFLNKDIDLGCHVVKVQVQGKCGSCYAIASLQTIFAIRKMKRLLSMPLAVAQIVACGVDKYPNLFGCNGGFFTGVFQYVQERGVGYDFIYPYHNKKITMTKKPVCQEQLISSDIYKDSRTFISGYTRIQPGNCKQVILSLHLRKVLAIAIDAFGLEYYISGVFKPPELGKGRMRQLKNYNHAVTLVGYYPKLKAFKIRNSWGGNWGQSGFGLISETMSTICDYAYYPKVITNEIMEDKYDEQDYIPQQPSQLIQYEQELSDRVPSCCP